MRVRFWGVRGSIPVPGQATVRYGGNTSCLDILTSSGQVIIIDAGTGIRCLGQELLKEYERRVVAKIFLSHTHWDHIQGLPFFAPLISRRNHIDIYGGKRSGRDLEKILATQFFEPFLPFAYRSLQATVHVQEVVSGETIFIDEETTLSIADLNHPGGAIGFRVENDDIVFAYCCDTGHDVNDFKKDVLALAQDADLLVHDTHFASPDLSSKFADWGHSSWHEAVKLAHAAGVKNLGMFHYSPDLTDDELDSIKVEVQTYFPRTILTREGMVLHLPLGEDLPV